MVLMGGLHRPFSVELVLFWLQVVLFFVSCFLFFNIGKIVMRLLGP